MYTNYPKILCSLLLLGGLGWHTNLQAEDEARSDAKNPAPSMQELQQEMQEMRHQLDQLRKQQKQSRKRTKEDFDSDANSTTAGSNWQDRLSIGGYGEIKYRNYRSFYQTDILDLHRFVLEFGYEFNDWIRLASEIEYEHAGFDREDVITQVDMANQTATQQNINEGEVFVEFAYLDFDILPAFGLQLGLNLVPIGITNHQHEPTTFYSVERPLTETVIIPSTWREIGALAYGKILGERLTYRTGLLGAGRAKDMSASAWIRGARTKGSRSRAEGLAYIFNLDYEADGLLLGGSYYTGRYGQNEIAQTSELQRVSGFENSGSTTPDVNDPVAVYLYVNEVETRDLADVQVHLTEAHIQYQWNAWRARGLISQGWMNEPDTRAVNRHTGRNIGMAVEGAYIEIAYNIFSLLDTDHKLYLMIRNEYVNTQKETARRYPGDFEDILDLVCTQRQICLATSDLTQGNRDLGFIESSNATARGPLGAAVPIGEPDRVNDRRIMTYALAYFPDPQVVIKLDYERRTSKTAEQADIERFNPDNNKIDRINASVGFTF